MKDLKFNSIQEFVEYVEEEAHRRIAQEKQDADTSYCNARESKDMKNVSVETKSNE